MVSATCIVDHTSALSTWSYQIQDGSNLDIPLKIFRQSNLNVSSGVWLDPHILQNIQVMFFFIMAYACWLKHGKSSFLASLNPLCQLDPHRFVANHRESSSIAAEGMWNLPGFPWEFHSVVTIVVGCCMDPCHAFSAAPVFRSVPAELYQGQLLPGHQVGQLAPIRSFHLLTAQAVPPAATVSEPQHRTGVTGETSHLGWFFLGDG